MGQLEEMELFIRIVDAGSISKAAEQTNIAKSAVSRRLSELESRIGKQLLVRTTRHSRVTEFGKKFYEQAKRIIDDVETLNADAAKETQQSIKGELRLTAPLEFGVMHLPRLVARFNQLHPDLLIHLDFTNNHSNLIEDGYDMALRIAHLKDSTLHARTLCSVEHILVASPEYLDKYGTPNAPQDLVNHKLLAYSLASFNLTKMTNNDGVEFEFQPATVLKSDNGFFLKEMCITGMGIVCLPAFILYDAIAQGKLTPLFSDYQFTNIDLRAIYPDSRFPNLKVRAFIDFLKEELHGPQLWDQV